MCGNNTIYFEYYSNYQTYQTYLLILIEDADDIVYKRNTRVFILKLGRLLWLNTNYI